MGLTIGETARLLGVSEHVVRGYLAAGKLPFGIRGACVVIPQAAVDAMLHPEKNLLPPETAPSARSGISAQEETVRAVLMELFRVQEQLEDRLDLVHENQRLHHLLRDKDRALAERNAEIDRLKRELIHQRGLAEMEVEQRRRTLEEKLIVLEEQASRQLALEQERCREELARSEEHWTRRLAEERERSARERADARRHEGFWARLTKMLTWS